MASVEIKIPSVGESINEATIGRWNFKTGDFVEKDAVVLEIETEKATMEVSAPASGRITVKINQGQTVAIGTTVADIDTSAEKSSSAAKPSMAAPSKPTPPPKPVSTDDGIFGGKSSSAPSSPVPAASPKPAAPPSGGGLETVELRGLGPAARKAVREGKMNAPVSASPAPTPATATSTGPSARAPSPAPASVPARSPTPATIDYNESEAERKPMSTIRRKIAERLLHSQQSTATLTTFNEVDMSSILNVRKQVQDEFTRKHGVKLGFMSFFTKAVCAAAVKVPTVNAFIDGTDVVYNKHVHAGIAVSTDRGLVVPVLRYADKLSYAEIEKQILDLAERARKGRLGIEEMTGGTFTVTNGGVFGSLLSTPILNPPQSAILGMHKTEHRPVAVEDKNGGYGIEVKPMMYLAMSYDHRLIDGRDSVTFLVAVKEYLETVTKDQVL
jgi:2-oxoglutarate dehydrogenase E2 component (dihydrolipoamide succinyltransferase)